MTTTQLSWSTEKRKVRDLVPAEYNPRQMNEKQAKELEKSLKKFGLVEIPAIDQDNTLLAGHMRMATMIQLGRGEEEIDVRVPNRKLTDAEAKEYNLRSNKNTGEWDMDKLFAMPDGLLEEVGWDKKEIQKLIDGHTTVQEDDYDPEEGLKKPVRVHLGEIWQLGSHRLMCGDSTKRKDVERLMDGQKAEMLFTSPPYADMREYGGDDVSVEKISEFIAVFDSFCAYQVINLGIKREDHEIVSYWDVYIEKARLLGLKLMAWNVWAKNGAGSVGQQSAFIPIAHEWIFVFGRVFKDINRTRERKTEIERGVSSGTMRQSDGTTKRRSLGVQEDKKEMESVFFQNAERGTVRKDHPATFPLALPTEYIKSMRALGDAVCDPFGGSGSTLIACEQTNRKCYMMEINPRYATVILDRWEKLTNQKAIKL